jgi:hypothetical protein
MLVPPRNAAPLSEELAELVASGVDVYVATRNAGLEPESMLAMGVKIHADGYGLTVYLPEALSAATVANLRDNAQIAITMARPRDHHAVQIKGRSLQIRRSEAADRELQAVCRAALVEQFAWVGIPRSATRRLVWWPSLAVDVEVGDVFVQTPGPQAGEPLTAS